MQNLTVQRQRRRSNVHIVDNSRNIIRSAEVMHDGASSISQIVQSQDARKLGVQIQNATLDRERPYISRIEGLGGEGRATIWNKLKQLLMPMRYPKMKGIKHDRSQKAGLGFEIELLDRGSGQVFLLQFLNPDGSGRWVMPDISEFIIDRDIDIIIRQSEYNSAFHVNGVPYFPKIGEKFYFSQIGGYSGLKPDESFGMLKDELVANRKNSGYYNNRYLAPKNYSGFGGFSPIIFDAISPSVLAKALKMREENAAGADRMANLFYTRTGNLFYARRRERSSPQISSDDFSSFISLASESNMQSDKLRQIAIEDSFSAIKEETRVSSLAVPVMHEYSPISDSNSRKNIIDVSLVEHLASVLNANTTRPAQGLGESALFKNKDEKVMLANENSGNAQNKAGNISLTNAANTSNTKINKVLGAQRNGKSFSMKNGAGVESFSKTTNTLNARLKSDIKNTKNALVKTKQVFKKSKSNSRLNMQKKTETLGRVNHHSKSTQQTRINAVLFDLDGVLADSEELHRKTFNEIFSRYGVNIPKNYWLANYTGTGSRHILHDVLKKNNIKADEKKLLVERMELFAKEVEDGKLKTIDGAPELVKLVQLHSLKVGVASGGHKSNIKAQLVSLGMEKLPFAGLEDVKNRKPDPEVFSLMAKRLGIAPSSCLVIEDSAAGLQAAKSAGMKCILIGKHHSKSIRAKADLWVGKLGAKKLTSFVRRLAGKK